MLRRHVLTVSLAVTASTSPLAGQGWIEPLRERHPDFGVVKVGTAVTVEVEGRIAHVEVEEWFRNDGRTLGEGDYLYPLPGEAVFSDFSLYQGDQELRGETMDARHARAIYEEIVRRKRDPALIELAGHGLVRARVFPIEPGDTRRITLRYTQVMDRAGDALQFRYVAGTRTGPVPRRSLGEEPRPRPRAPSNAPFTFVLRAERGAMFGDPFSPTHPVAVDRSDGGLSVRPEGELRGRFALFLPLATDRVGMVVATHRPSPGEPGYFMLTLSPATADGPPVPRDVTAVVDVSGSMSGDKLRQAKAALRQLLSSLNPDDRFRLVAFSNAVTAQAADWARVTPASVGAAGEWIDDLVANGGTNIAGALTEAFRAPTPEGRLAVVLFLTDGLPSVGEQDPERIAASVAATRGRARVFAFGVGFDVNTLLLDRLSAEGHGSTQYVQPGEDVEVALGHLSAKIRHPVLTDLDLDASSVRLTEIFPVRLPDLFAGEELVLFGRYETAGRQQGALTVHGRRAGRVERYDAETPFPAHALGNDFIPRLWAARKLGFLTRQVRLEGQTDDLLREIRETATRYGLLSEYTSYLVQEPSLLSTEPPAAWSPLLRGRQDVDASGRPLIVRTSPTPPAAAAQPAGTGQRAVAAAEASRRHREVRHEGELDALAEGFASRVGGDSAQVAGGRLFVLRDGVWTDLSRRDSVATVDIEPFSDAYFAVLSLAPELEPWFSRFDRLLVAGTRVNLRVVAGGARALGGAELARLVRAFRGL